MSRTMNHSLSDRAAPTSQEFITQIYKKYDRLMLFTAKKYLMDIRECEDAVQESLLKLMSRIELLRTLEEPVLTSYVVTTVRNTAINILRRQKRDAQNITSFTESVEESIIEPDSIIEASNPVPAPLLGHRCRSSQEITGSPTPFSTSNHYLWICESASFSLSNPNIAA